MMVGGLAVENREELSVPTPSGFPEYVEPPPQSVAKIERSKYRAAWHEAMKVDLDGYKTTGTYERSRDTPARVEPWRCNVGVYLQGGQGCLDSRRLDLCRKCLDRYRMYFRLVSNVCTNSLVGVS